MARKHVGPLLALAQHAEITGVGWRSLSRFYDALPSDLTGLRVLDICAGMSDCAFRLRERGAEAYAVDLAYADLESMYARHRRSFEVTAANVFKVAPGSPRAGELYQTFVAGFEAGLRSHPSMYVAASATALPFPSESFDFAVSFNGIFGTLDFDAGVLSAALGEAIRVTRPGGTVQLVPYLEGPVLDDLERSHQRAAIEALKAVHGIAMSDAVARSEALLGGGIGRLTIVKNGRS